MATAHTARETNTAAPAEPPVAAGPPAWTAVLPPGKEVWVFGYGSLMWNPGFAHAERQPALLRGYHRRFCLYSHGYRGTPECPGLVLGLDRGGACRGLAFRVPAAEADSALDYLWEREMDGGSYQARLVPVCLGDGRTVSALAFIIDRRQPRYAGHLTTDEMARIILRATGERGPCRDYLVNTVRHLEQMNMLDGTLGRLERRVRELAAEAG